MHIPVLLDEVVAALAPVLLDGSYCLDATFGAGGYSRKLLESIAGKVIGLDRDPNVLQYANLLTHEYPARFSFIKGDFASVENYGLPPLNAAVFDLGVSSMQIDQGERGFSFYHDGPLDMRMDPDLPITAAHVVNKYAQDDIANILYQFGDEHFSRRIARAIVHQRVLEPFITTLQLANCIKRVLGHKPGRIHPATKSFQALRIYVNDELNQLPKALEAIKNIIVPGGRIAVVTFHSGEDKIVKNIFNHWCGKQEAIWDNQLPIAPMSNLAMFRMVYKKAIAPQAQEISDNVRARSAKLRVVEKLKMEK